jgi:hypothetical protein
VYEKRHPSRFIDRFQSPSGKSKKAQLQEDKPAEKTPLPERRSDEWGFAEKCYKQTSYVHVGFAEGTCLSCCSAREALIDESNSLAKML